MSKYSATQTEQIKEIGNYLRQQRLKNSLTLEQLASTTFIRLQMLKALEGGNIEQLPELIYVQGFIRRYGDAVQLDGRALSHQITAQTEEKPEISPNLVAPPSIEESLGQEPPPKATHKRKKSAVAVASQPRILPDLSQETEEKAQVTLPKQVKLIWVYLLLLGVAVGGLFYLFPRPPAAETRAKNNQPETVKPSPTQPQEKPQSSEASKPEKFISSEKPSPLLTTPTETPTEVKPTTEKPETPQPTVVSNAPVAPEKPPETAVTPTPEPTVSHSVAPTGPVSAAVQLEDDSWVKVEVDGKTEYEGILEKGSQQTWKAQENLIIRAGNAGAVKLSVNNKPAELLGALGEVKEKKITPDGQN
ncbi:helix-turn-helix domain-containing protein [Crocosphaera sp. XPORK-15E]|uniref:helix-turn-helix domain-containing protein n=1 Tax=Crocosphaera sp. XPORK-15E TaxID=3110247 RepID=UPI002B20BE0A|nr:RodZ domain-containing protein [Crocosphaera sp. XPORK-15E]MEA5533705.1 RodZ domain-containing protein [Crocosphaera sp. XPORK-15E]